MSSEKVMLVVGSCGLDRLLTVSEYPEQDAKVRTTSYTEIGGGNAANTACVMGRLATAKIFRDQNFRIKLLTKLGGDEVGQQLRKELHTCNVDTSSPLFVIGEPETTTAFTTIVVSQTEQTRTCFHTPGTCGELNMKDLGDGVNWDDVFANVVHLHSDSRHTEVALALVQEAKRRHISVSCDSEKDRKTRVFDELMEATEIVFTNANYLNGYLGRLEAEKQTQHSRPSLPKASVTSHTKELLPDTIDICSKALTPSAYFARWHGGGGKKHVVVTQGHKGALSYGPLMVEAKGSGSVDSPTAPMNGIEIVAENGNIELHHNYQDKVDGRTRTLSMRYTMHLSGVVENAEIVDTTGSGDAFIGGYLVAITAFHSVPFALQFGSWVGGIKLRGPGARNALPEGAEVDKVLGTDQRMVTNTLLTTLRTFNDDPAMVLGNDGLS